jgi:hypothetical protein
MTDFQVPVIAVFTKCDQFRRDIMIKMEDERGDLALLDVEVENNFKVNYLAHLGESPRFVRLESEDFVSQSISTLLMSVVQICINLPKGVLPLSKRP